MKTFLINPVLRGLTAKVMVGSLALASPSLLAQTFTGREYLAESSGRFRAFIQPDSQREAFKIRLENRGAGAVRIRILDEKQYTVYDDYVTKSAYYGRFDVSALAYGTYTIELSTQTARQTEQFHIERPMSRRIVLAAKPAKPDSLLADNPSVIRRKP